MKSIQYTILVVILLTLITTPVYSQEKQTEQQSPPPSTSYCQSNEGFDEWDFWVGEWNVYSNDEKRLFAGTNSITKHYNNCLIIEDWTNSQGSGGMSMNYYNPITGQWRQVWVSNGNAIDYMGGLNNAGEMVLSGEIFTYQTGARQKFKGIWTAEENGDVIQHFDIHNAKDDTWSTWFEGRYVRKDNDLNPPGIK